MARASHRGQEMKYELLMEGWRDWLRSEKEVEEPLPEPEEEEDEQSSMEVNLAMLLMREEEDQATMMFEMLASSDDPKYKLDLDLLAAEIDDRLRAEWEALPAPTMTNWSSASTPEEVAQMIKYSDAWQAWAPKLGAAVRFVTGGDSTQGFRPSTKVYERYSLKDTLARHLRMTVHKMKKPSPDTSDESLMENWRQYLKDNNLDKLPLGAAPGSYKFKSAKEMEEYTDYINQGKIHKLNVTWEDLLHAMFIGGRPLADYADEGAEDWEARRAKEAEEAGLPHPWAQQGESDETPI